MLWLIVVFYFSLSAGKMPPVLASREVGQIPVLCGGPHGRVQHAPVHPARVQSDWCQGKQTLFHRKIKILHCVNGALNSLQVWCVVSQSLGCGPTMGHWMAHQGFTNKIQQMFNFKYGYVCIYQEIRFEWQFWTLTFNIKFWHCIKYLFIPNHGLKCNISINIYLWELWHMSMCKNKCGAGSTELPEFLIPSKAYADKWCRLPPL